MDWKKIFPNDISNRGSVSKLYKGLYKIDNSGSNIIYKWAKDFNRYLTKGDTWITGMLKKKKKKLNIIRYLGNAN